MRTIIQTIPNDTSSFIISDEINIPKCYSNEILIRVNCCSINQIDILQAEGKFLLFLSNHSNNSNQNNSIDIILGIEISGTIIAMSDDCELDFHLNDSIVAYLPNSGGYSEFVIIHERNLMKAISGLSVHQLCTIPEAFMTAYMVCFDIGKIHKDEIVLIHDGLSSTSMAMIQMLTLQGNTVYSTVFGFEHISICESLGVKKAFLINKNASNNDNFIESIIHINQGKLINVIIDPLGSMYLYINLTILEIDSKLIYYNIIPNSGNIVDRYFLNKLLDKRITLITTSLYHRSIDYRYKIMKLLSEDPIGFPSITSGKIKILIDKIYEMDDIVLAYEYTRDLYQYHNVGKSVISITSTSNAIDFFQKELLNIEKRNYICRK